MKGASRLIEDRLYRESWKHTQGRATLGHPCAKLKTSSSLLWNNKIKIPHENSATVRTNHVTSEKCHDDVAIALFLADDCCCTMQAYTSAPTTLEQLSSTTIPGTMHRFNASGRTGCSLREAAVQQQRKYGQHGSWLPVTGYQIVYLYGYGVTAR